MNNDCFNRLSKEHLEQIKKDINKWQAIQILIIKRFPLYSNAQLEGITLCQAKIGFLFSQVQIN